MARWLRSDRRFAGTGMATSLRAAQSTLGSVGDAPFIFGFEITLASHDLSLRAGCGGMPRLAKRIPSRLFAGESSYAQNARQFQFI